MEKRPFFRAAMAGLGKHCMGGYGRIGVNAQRVLLTRPGVCSKGEDICENNGALPFRILHTYYMYMYTWCYLVAGLDRLSLWRPS